MRCAKSSNRRSVDQLNRHFDIWYSPEELAIAHQIRLEIRREKGLKTTVYLSSSSQHFAVLNVDEMLNENVE